VAKVKSRKKSNIIHHAIEKSKYDYIFDLILFVSFFIFLFFLTTFKISGDDDVFWHFATGKFILNNGYVPSSDVFGFVTTGQEWMPFEWGWDVLSYSIFSFSGYVGFSILRTLILSITFFNFWWILKKFKVSNLITFIFLFILSFAIIDRLTPRPHLMSYLFFSLVLLIICEFRYFKRKNFKVLYFLPLIFLIWANMHMGIIAGLLLLGIYIVSEIIHTIYFSKSSDIQTLNKNELIKLTVIGAICFLVIFVNPNGFATYLYAYNHTKMKMLETVNEWLSPFSTRYKDSFVSILYKMLLFAGFIPIIISLIKKDIFPVLLVFIFGIYSVRAMRFTIDYILVTFIFIIISIYYLLQKSNIVLRLLVNPFPRIILTIIFLLLISPISNNNLYLKTLEYYRISGYGINSDFIPVQMFDFIQENKIDSIGQRPFNHFGTGGYLVFRFPESKNFIDSRNLNDSIFYEYNNIIGKKPGFEKKLKDFNIDYSLYLAPDLIRMPEEMKQTIISYFSENSDWKLIFWDDKSFLFVHNEDKFFPLIKQFEYKYLNPYNIYYKTNIIDKALKEDPEQLKKEINRKLQEDPNGFIIKNIVNKLKL
jgi:hypothetical protein